MNQRLKFITISTITTLGLNKFKLISFTMTHKNHKKRKRNKKQLKYKWIKTKQQNNQILMMK